MNKSLIDSIKNYKVRIINIVNDKNEDIELNKIVKNIFVINLIDNIVKRNYITVLMEKYKINFTFVIVERISSELYQKLCKNSLISKGELGCCLSHLWCLYQIIKNNYENAVIFEDDIILHKNFIKHFLNILYNKNIDFLLLGAHDFSFSQLNYKNIKNYLYSPNEKTCNLYGAHANYYYLQGAKRMFAIRTSEISFFDKEYMLMFNYFKDTSFICYPNLVVSNITDSSLNHERKVLSNLELEYYKKCFIKFDFKQYNYIYLNLLNNSIKINENDSYENYINKCLYYLFYNFDKTEIIKNRLVMDFFTLKDIIVILNINNSK